MRNIGRYDGPWTNPYDSLPPDRAGHGLGWWAGAGAFAAVALTGGVAHADPSPDPFGGSDVSFGFTDGGGDLFSSPGDTSSLLSSTPGPTFTDPGNTFSVDTSTTLFQAPADTAALFAAPTDTTTVQEPSTPADLFTPDPAPTGDGTAEVVLEPPAQDAVTVAPVEVAVTAMEPGGVEVAEGVEVRDAVATGEIGTTDVPTTVALEAAFGPSTGADVARGPEPTTAGATAAGVANGDTGVPTSDESTAGGNGSTGTGDPGVPGAGGSEVPDEVEPDGAPPVEPVRAQQPADGTEPGPVEAAGRPEEQVDAAPEPDAGGISPQAVVAAGAGGAALEWARSSLGQLAERVPATAAGQSAKATTATVDGVRLDPRQERALHALNTDPIGTLADPDTFLSTMEGPARTLTRNGLSELGWGGLSLAAGVAGAPGGPALQVPLIAAAKAGQKEILDPAIDRALAPPRSSTVVAGPDGTMAGPGGRTELLNPLGEPTSSSPVDDQLTRVDGRPLTHRNTPVLTTVDGRPLATPNALQRFVDGISASQQDAVTIYGADGGPVRDAPVLLGADGRPMTPTTPGSVLRPGTTFGGAELADVLATPGSTQAAALAELGIPTTAELRTTLPGDTDPAVVERRAVDLTVDGAGARQASGALNAVPEDLSGASWRRTAGDAGPRPALSRRTVAAVVGEGTKQTMRAALTVSGVPAAAATALEAGTTACVAAVCGAVGRAAEEAVRGSEPGSRAASMGAAARADFAATFARSATALEPDQLLTLGAATGAGLLGRRATVPVPPVSAVPSRVGGAGAVVAGVAAPFVRQGLVDAGVLPRDPLLSDWRGQTATVLANVAEGAAGGLTSRGDAITGAVGNGINSFRRDTTAGRRLEGFARSTPTASGDPVGDRVRAAGSAAANRTFQLGNLAETIPNAFTSTGQLLGTVAAAGWDHLDGGYTMPLSDYAAELNAMSGPTGTRRALQEIADTETRYDRNRREVVLGLPERPATAPGGHPWCTSTADRDCVRPGSVDPDDPNSVGQLQQGRLEPGHPRYAAAVAAGRAGDQSRPGMPAYGRGPAGVGTVGPLYVGDGSGRDGPETFARNMTTPGGIRHNVTTVVDAVIDHVRRSPVGAAVIRLMNGR